MLCTSSDGMSPRVMVLRRPTPVVSVPPSSTGNRFNRAAIVKYTIDDGTGLLACTQYEFDARKGATHRGRAESHELGELLVVQGKLKRYRG